MKRVAMVLVMLTLLIGLTIPGCNGGSTGNGGSNGYVPPPNQTTEPTAISQQTRVVLAEMFTGDW